MTLAKATFRHSLHASIYSAQGIENDVFTRLPNITSAFCVLDLWPPDPKVDHLWLCPGGRFTPICIEIGSFVFKVCSVHKLVKRGVHYSADKIRKGTEAKMAISAHLPRRAPKKVGGASIPRPCLGMSTVRGHDQELRGIMQERRSYRDNADSVLIATGQVCAWTRTKRKACGQWRSFAKKTRKYWKVINFALIAGV